MRPVTWTQENTLPSGNLRINFWIDRYNKRCVYANSLRVFHTTVRTCIAAYRLNTTLSGKPMINFWIEQCNKRWVCPKSLAHIRVNLIYSRATNAVGYKHAKCFYNFLLITCTIPSRSMTSTIVGADWAFTVRAPI